MILFDQNVSFSLSIMHFDDINNKFMALNGGRMISVIRLGYFWKVLMTNLLTKVAQLFGDALHNL